MLSLFRPWLKRDYFHRYFEIPTFYLIRHLDAKGKSKVHGYAHIVNRYLWQNRRHEELAGEMKKSKTHGILWLNLHKKKHLFRFDDGLTRDGATLLKAYKGLRAKKVRCYVRISEW